MRYLLLILLLVGCGQDTQHEAQVMIPKCQAFAFTDTNFNVQKFSDDRVTKACKVGASWNGLYVVKSLDAVQPATLCGFWVIDGRLVTLDTNEMTINMSNYEFCN